MARFAKELFDVRHDLVVASSRYKKTAIYKDLKCPIYNYLLSLNSESSQHTVSRVLQTIARHMGRESIYEIRWGNFNSGTINTLIDSLKSNGSYAPNTITLYISVVKQVVEHAYLLGQMSTRQRDAIKSKKVKTGSRTKEYTLLNHEDVNALLSKVAGNNQDYVVKCRDYAIFSILLRCGLRREEVTNLKVSDVKEKAIRVIGKGNKERKVAMHPVVLEAINKWVAVYSYSNKSKPLFVRILKGGHIQNEKLSPDAIFKLCNKYDAPAPHSLRRSFATNLYKNGANIKNISLLLGHNNISTTEIYVRRDDEDLYNEVIQNLL
ncbi:tyrosine-type recombinase/integrase [Pseudoalteromonas sp. AC163]|uniref:tyrosine-type recombinase/integrase n=1 Tax=Pseudoalteromonas sp. AC163 TaxID=1055790 RepID=UPI0004170953|nr:tyrosine-type recombinase/integrase [Pseudoalteromonas sp. AC163]